MGLTVGLVAVGAGMSVAQGFLEADAIGDQAQAASAAASREAQRFETEAKLARTQARQEEGSRRTELSRLLGTQRAQAAAQGVMGASLNAIQAETKRVAGRDIQNIRLLGSSQNRKLTAAGAESSRFALDTLSAAGDAQTMAVIGGVSRAGTSLFSTGLALQQIGDDDLPTETAGRKSRPSDILGHSP
jgi:hypothetical protein